MKTYYFISGLPRSGSTLLANILAQNPRFHATATSGIMDIIFGVRNQWDRLVEFKAVPDEEAKQRVMLGILENFYAPINKPVIFDKSRGWLSLIEMTEELLGKVKILVPVRDIRDVLASMEKIYRRKSATAQMDQEAENYMRFQTVEGRCKFWMENPPIGLAYSRIKDALQRGFEDRMHFVDFNNLTSKPKETLEGIYAFLGEEPFTHDFLNVEQITWENDEVHGIKGLHDIRNKVEPMNPQWPKILGQWAENYKQLNNIWTKQ